ncbi:hypothetical protein [Spirosoma montaniterrae]|uniref:Uncharacterized protein n=1 Tax=Spirosoma montaniterrae TaxID=1178516 RepID=A0A1P9X012_9BACT|nr:hypothetical protein [Spirosoma montaniterrae]AQG80971.1 hypothetical protein AWR27_17560 [Spirosoma montaniterrae]
METNPFKALEPTDTCPPHMKEQIVSEIDTIRNTMTIIQLYVGELFSMASALADFPHQPQE